MLQYGPVVIAPFGHYGSTYLAQSYAMSPSCSCQDEPLRNTVFANVKFVDDKG